MCFEHGVTTISTGEVSELAQRFATYFARLHRHCADKIKAALEADGGWPLHVDATGEAGRGTLLVAMAGWRQWVLGAWKISTEREELILPCLREVVLTHSDNHGKNLWGHAIRLPESAGGGVRLVARTNLMAESFFKMLKHNERRRSGRKNLGQDLEHLRAEAALVRNLEHEDYMRIVCGSLNQLPAAFAELDKLERQKRLNGESIKDQEDDLQTILQLASASLSPADRRIVRDEKMDHRIEAAARSRAPRRRHGPPVKSNPTGS